MNVREPKITSMERTAIVKRGRLGVQIKLCGSEQGDVECTEGMAERCPFAV